MLDYPIVKWYLFFMQNKNERKTMKTKIEKAKLLFKSKANATNILKLVGLIDEIKKEEKQKGKTNE